VIRPVLLVCVAVLGCSKNVPAHLRLDTTPSESSTQQIVDAESAVHAIIGRDPLARNPTLVDPNVLDEIDGGAPLAAFVRGVKSLEQGEGPVERVLQQLEDEWRATAVVPLARGYRLRIAENQLANTLIPPEERQRQVAVLLTPLNGNVGDPTLPLDPLDWMTAAGGDELVRAYGDRWVTAGWLSDPKIPTQAARDALGTEPYDGLRATESGRLLWARAQRLSSGGADAGVADLTLATGLALERAGADRDSEQTAWDAKQTKFAEELGTPDPVGGLLRRSFDRLAEDAGDDEACGGALLASAALRWLRQCDTRPCGGLDRVETMQFASRFDPSIAPLSAVWQVVALKEAIDTLEVGRSTALFPAALLDLSDALLGTGGGPLEVEILRRRSPDAQVWLIVARAVGDEGITDWEGVRVVLGEHLAGEARRAAALVQDPEWKALLERIGARSVP
jgi:hypothetical protein